MITAIELENFKGVGSPVRIPIRPVTLLFGANSAGKSTVLQALQYAYEILVNGNIDVDQTEQGQESLNLGGYRQMVHNRDIIRDIKLAFDLDLSGDDLPLLGNMVRKDDDDTSVDLDISALVDTARIELTIHWNEYKNQPFVKTYGIHINGEHAAELYHPNDESFGVSLSYNTFHPISAEYWLSEEDIESDEIYDWIDMQVDDLDRVIPPWDKKLELYTDDEENILPFREEVLSQILVGVGKLFTDYLTKMRHIGPIREIIPRNYEGVRSISNSRWYSGLAAWDHLLYRSEKIDIERISEWLSDPKKLNSGYGIEVLDGMEMIEDKFSSDSFSSDFGDITGLKEIYRKKLIQLVAEDEEYYSLHDVGVGFSQLIPVVIASLLKSSRILCVEQPELHVHPAVQVGLGDLFATQIHERPGALFLLETHSEHIILRLIRRIREAYEGIVPDGVPKLKPEDLSIVYIETDEGEMKVTPIGLDRRGEFTNRWPKGFFDERDEELF